MKEYELSKACYKMLKEMFNLQPGESIAITCDTESNMDVVDATARAAAILDAKPVVIKTIAARADGRAGDIDLPQAALIGAIKNCDAWVEFNGKWIFYSDTYDQIIADPENRPRYLCLVGVNRDVLVRNINRVDNEQLNKFILRISDYMENAKHIKVTTPKGFCIESDNAPGRKYVTADGYVNKGDIKMFPGQINWAPKHETINGVMVIDGFLEPPFGRLREEVKLTIENGYITKVEGGQEAAQYKAWLESFNDPEMFHVAHGGLGFGPYATLETGIVEAERVWGCTEWGIGNCGPQMLSDVGHAWAAASHSDGICLNASCWVDGVQVLDEGEVCGPDQEQIELAHMIGH